PLTTAGVTGVAAADAGAASGIVNVAHQLGGSLGLGVLVTVFASALPQSATRTLASTSTQDAGIAHAISTALTAGSVMLALALLAVLALRRRAPRAATVHELPLVVRNEDIAA